MGNTTTRNLVPRADGQGHIGVTDKRWQGMAMYTLTADDIVSPVIDAIYAELGEKAAQTALEAAVTAIEVTLATKATNDALAAVKATADAAAVKADVDAEIVRIDGELATKATVAALVEVKVTADSAAPKTYVDAEIAALQNSIINLFEIDENGDLMPKGGAVV